jgi:hypothetical protein
MRTARKTWKAGMVMMLLLLIAATVQAGVRAEEGKKSEAKATFYVYCFDVGARALKDLKGVVKVQKGFKNSKEINTVQYNPEKITVKKMEEALKKAGTYRGTDKKT